VYKFLLKHNNAAPVDAINNALVIAYLQNILENNGDNTRKNLLPKTSNILLSGLSQIFALPINVYKHKDVTNLIRKIIVWLF
jgi:hypothetical protein